MAEAAILITQDLSPQRYLVPSWPAPDNVLAVSTKRDLNKPFGKLKVNDPMAGFNLVWHANDCMQRTTQTRRELVTDLKLTKEPTWLNQVHGNRVAHLPFASGQVSSEQTYVEADASTTREIGQACVVMTADCLPVLFCNQQGSQVAAAHAGWRGLADSVLENTLAKFDNPQEVLAWLGPAIGPGAFEVGEDVRQAFVNSQLQDDDCFILHNKRQKKYLANIYQLAKNRLNRAGVQHISGGEYCTFTSAQDFYSYRRDPNSGRQASLITLI